MRPFNCCNTRLRLYDIGLLICGRQTAPTCTPSPTRVSASCSSVYKKSIVNNLDQLKQRVLEVWNRLQQNIVDAGIGECRKRLQACVRTHGRHFVHLLSNYRQWPYVTIGDRRLPPSAKASNGPNTHPRINHKITKSPSVVLTWVHTNNGTIPLSNENTHLGSPTITHSASSREHQLQA